MEIANQSGAEFKTLVIGVQRTHRMWQQHKERRNVMLSKIKKNPQETNSEGKGARNQINKLEHNEEINIQPEKKK